MGKPYHLPNVFEIDRVHLCVHTKHYKVIEFNILPIEVIHVIKREVEYLLGSLQ